MHQRKLNAMRPCVRRAFEEGVDTAHGLSDESRLFRHAIAVELKRTGLDLADAKGEIMKWNDRCSPPLPPNAVRRQLTSYVEWVYRGDRRFSCNIFRDNDACLHPEGGCPFSGMEKMAELPYTIGQARNWLEREYPQYGRGYVAGLVFSGMMASSRERGCPVTLFCALREISDRVYGEFTHDLDVTQVSRAVRLLEDAGFIETEPGSSGIRSGKANAYRFLPRSLAEPINDNNAYSSHG